MRVLRAHKDSVMAVLEAFVYDPLLNWRLIDCKIWIHLYGFLKSYSSPVPSSYPLQFLLQHTFLLNEFK